MVNKLAIYTTSSVSHQKAAVFVLVFLKLSEEVTGQTCCWLHTYCIIGFFFSCCSLKPPHLTCPQISLCRYVIFCYIFLWTWFTHSYRLVHHLINYFFLSFVHSCAFVPLQANVGFGCDSRFAGLSDILALPDKKNRKCTRLESQPYT